MHQKSFAAFIALALVGVQAYAAPAGLDETIVDLTHRWAKVNYQTAPDQKEAGYRDVIAATEQAAQAYPGRAEPLVWEAIALSSAAKVEGGLGGLSKAKRARDLLLAAEKLDPDVLAGSVYCSLGSLYAKVPGWPIGFGDKDKATAYLKHALALNPDGLDPNYFYGELLADQGRYAEAAARLNRALAAPARVGREDSDAGRRLEVQAALEILRKQHGDPLGGL